MLKALGATTGKAIPKPLLEAAQAGDAETLAQLEARRIEDRGESAGDLVQ